MPLIAILRGLETTECVKIAGALFAEGIEIVEVPLNSPSPYETLKELTATFTDKIIGAGTVTLVEQVQACVNSGCQLIVAPNFNHNVAKAVLDNELIYCPGVTTPTEALYAAQQGAHTLKLFPGELVLPDVVRAIGTILPSEIRLISVGGITTASLFPYLAAGSSGFGIGSALYKPGDSCQQARDNSRKFVKSLRAARSRLNH